MSAELLITDAVDPRELGGLCGAKPRDFSQFPIGSIPCAAAASFPLIPRSEWADRIREMERDKSRLSDIITAAKIPCLYQDYTNFCHGFAPTLAIMAKRAFQGQPFVELSGSSVGAPASNFQNVGQFIFEDLKQITNVGCASVEFVPQVQVTRDGFTPGWEQDAAKYRVTEWWDLGQRDRTMFDRVMTLLLVREPVCVCLNWWEHAVCFTDPVNLQGGGFGIRFRNSHGPQFGDDGFALLDESRGTPDEAYAIRSVTVSA